MSLNKYVCQKILNGGKILMVECGIIFKESEEF